MNFEKGCFGRLLIRAFDIFLAVDKGMWRRIRHLVSHHHFPCLNSYTGLQLITESNSNCPLLHIALLQYINHLIWLVSCTFLTSPDNSDHLPHSSFLFPELNWTWASVHSLLLHPSFGMNSQPHWNLVKFLPLSVNISKLISSKLLFHLK